MTEAEEFEKHSSSLPSEEQEFAAHAGGGALPPAAPSEPPGIGQAIGTGFSQGLSYNHTDELAGLIDKIKGLEYDKGRDLYRSNESEAKAAHPWYYGGAKLAGGLISPVNKVLGPIKGAGWLLNTGKAALSGAAEGMGASEGHSPWDVLKDSSLGALFGLGGSALGHGASALVPTSKGAASTAQDLAVRHLRPTPAAMRVIGPAALKEIGQELLDTGAIKFGNKAGDTNSAIEGLLEDRGKKIGAHIEGATKTTSIGDITKKIEDEIIAPLEGTEANEGLVSKLRERVANLQRYYGSKPMTAKMAEEQKKGIYGNINFSREAPPAPVKAEKQLGRVFKEAGENLVGTPDFLKDKASFGKLSDALKMTGRTSSLTNGSGLMGHIGDMTAAHVALQALVHGNPLGLAVLGGRALTKGVTASSAAVTADKLAKFMAAHPYLDKSANLLQTGIQQVAPVAARQSPWELMR